MNWLTLCSVAIVVLIAVTDPESGLVIAGFLFALYWIGRLLEWITGRNSN